MSMWLSCGIATKITVIKDGNSSDNILKDLEKEVNLDIYNITEDLEYVFLDIKEKVFEENAISFIKEQLINFTNEKNILTDLDKLKNKSYDELIKISKSHECMFFQFIEGELVNNNVDYLIKGYTVYVDLVEYISDGKIFMECYNNIFYYLRKAIIKSSSNIIKTAMVITITG